MARRMCAGAAPEQGGPLGVFGFGLGVAPLQFGGKGFVEDGSPAASGHPCSGLTGLRHSRGPVQGPLAVRLPPNTSAAQRRAPPQRVAADDGPTAAVADAAPLSV